MGRRAKEAGAARVYSVVIVIAVLCYINALQGDFVHDDIPALTTNPDVLGTSPLQNLFNNDFWGTPMGDINSHKSYRPLTTLTFRASHWIAGLTPLWFHVGNVALHTLCCILFARATLAVAGLQTPFAAVSGLLFAAHPIHTEAVTGIVGRADVLACLFFLLSFLAYHDEAWWGREKRIFYSSLLAALSILAKETGVTVLLVNLLYDLYRSWPPVKRSIQDMRWNEESIQFARRAAKVFMVTSLLLVFRLAMLQGSLPRFSSQDNPSAFHPCPHVRLLTFCYLAAFNFWLLLCPATLSHDWQMGSIPLVTSLADYRNVATCLFFAGVLWLAYRIIADFESQKHAPLVLGALLLSLPFLPATNLLVTVGFVIAERVLYIPSLGLAMMVAYGAQMLYEKSSARSKTSVILSAGFCILLTSFGSRTLVRNLDWSSREALVRAGIQALPHNAKMHYNLGNFLRDTGKPELARTHYTEALRLWPSYASAHNNLGTLMPGAVDAEAHFLAAIRHSPGHVNAHYNLGQVYRKMNRSEEAVIMLERCLRLNAAYTPAYLLLAKLHSGPIVGRLLRHVNRLQPANADYLAQYAEWLQNNYRFEEAQRYYEKALRIQSDHKASFLGMAKTYRARGQKAQLHQLLLRWHMICCVQRRSRIVYTGDLYLRSWELYKPGQVTSLPEHAKPSHRLNHHHPHLACTNVEMAPLLVSGGETEEQTLDGLCALRDRAEKDMKPG
ncbi:protein O-mannosyl-transferase TMTC1-like [Lycorma delicatula]|uniref:protein O-mannosyl-transferase TMTC1-like n=1 Tax=Lycorma delicatula TaxID=130591 RepID=UPI003F514C24